MAISTTPTVVLEPAAQAFAEATSTPPFIYELTPAEARKVLDDVQAEPIEKLRVDEEWITVPADVGEARARIVRPPNVSGTLPAILYMHGGGWVLGNAHTHDRLVRELAVGTEAAVVFVEYARPRRSTPSLSSRATRQRSGSCATGPTSGSSRTTWPSPATRSAAA
jgi:acetyl esterase/lipase